jgi:hypothetical protein
MWWSLSSRPSPARRPAKPRYREDQNIHWCLADRLDEKRPDGTRLRLAGLGRWMKDIDKGMALKAIRRRKAKPWCRPHAKDAKPVWHPTFVTTIHRELNVLNAVWKHAMLLKKITGVTMNPWRDPSISTSASGGTRLEDEKAEALMVLAEEAIEKLRAVLQVEHHPRWLRWFDFMVGVGPRIGGCKHIDPQDDIEWDAAGLPTVVWITQKPKGFISGESRCRSSTSGRSWAPRA